MVAKLLRNIALFALLTMPAAVYAADLEAFQELFVDELDAKELSDEEIHEKLALIDKMREALAGKQRMSSAGKREIGPDRDHSPKRSRRGVGKKQREVAERPNPKILNRPRPKLSERVPEGANVLYTSDAGTVFYGSPEKNGSPVKSAIYTFAAVTGHDQANLPYEKRVNLTKVFPKKLTKRNIHEALLAVEINLRQGIKEDPSLVSRCIYAGLTSRDQSKRDKEHAGDIRYGKKDNSTKVKMLNIALGEHNVRRSWVIKNVDEWALPIFETMIANSLHVQTFGGSARIGDDASAAIVEKYNKSRIRQKRLSELGLDSVCETLGSLLFKNQMRALDFEDDEDMAIPEGNS